jgi:hypothetical protein
MIESFKELESSELDSEEKISKLVRLGKDDSLGNHRGSWDQG